MAFIPYDSDFDDTNTKIKQSAVTESNITSLLCVVVEQLKLLNARTEEAFNTTITKEDIL